VSTNALERLEADMIDCGQTAIMPSNYICLHYLAIWWRAAKSPACPMNSTFPLRFNLQLWMVSLITLCAYVDWHCLSDGVGRREDIESVTIGSLAKAGVWK